MGNTLDRLKALNDKLEVKLANKVETEVAPQASSGEKPEREVSEPNPATQKIEMTTAGDPIVLAKSIIAIMDINIQEEEVRVENIYRIAALYLALEINKKAPDFDDIFIYKAMNISGIGLKEEDFGEIREGKYCQIIAITYEPDKNGKKKAKNISLSYFGKAEKLEEGLKNDIMEFVLRWRYEKAFQNLEHYKYLLDKIKPSDKLF